MMGGNRGLGAGANACNFRIRIVASEMVENRLKRALVAKITGIKMPEKRHPLLLAYSHVHAAILKKGIVYNASLEVILDFREL